ncbi:uncharacterized protein LOC132746479 [Ruditapes philippinarum]|uniref:uncharacterized protein LOC132746479 n=1 Tax=Ruditapes philippinarum TaxID=129788 RepID=UPI00295A9C24|nr:uncharacterized protein LOC132746479 [Ruditapes philippinarum]
MEVSVYFTVIMTFISFLDNDGQVKAETCLTEELASYFLEPCHKKLYVENGRACYFGYTFAYATISCSSMYTFDASVTFMCRSNSWKPSSTALCSSNGFTMTTRTSTTSFTTKLLPTESYWLSSVISQETPFLTTYTKMSQTQISQIFSSVRTEPSSIKPSKTTTSNQLSMTSTVIATSVPVTGGTILDAGNRRPVYTWYIVGATVVGILGILLVVAIVIIVRLRRKLAMNETPDCDGDTSQQVPEYTELNISQANSNPYSALSKTNHRFVRDRTVTDNNDSTYLTPCTITNPDVSQEYINIDA